MEKDQLVVESFNVFKDKSARVNYRTLQKYRKDGRKPAAKAD
jgi:hypothetical protein